ncbi:hypothetical protein LZ554_002539 [Drepanopeziza brunnea f. sp. 'monogermtubi']|nr:hypothetical protein LZ554_002539 [Drepanopeziza brunnea f. sp. 'monogermtubi']
MDSSAVWAAQNPTFSVGPDEFQQFLDMGMSNLGDALQFDYQDFNQQHSQDMPLVNQGRGDAMDTFMGNGYGMGQDTTIQERIPMAIVPSHSSLHEPPLAQTHGVNARLSELDAQIQFLQHQKHEQQQKYLQEQQRNYYAQSCTVPPTPNSVEMHGGSAHYYTQPDQQQSMFERYQMHAKEHEIAFTPLVSPAVTPLEAHFNIPEYTAPGAYFSPLSSPALHAQTEHPSVYDQRHSGATNSPIDTNPDAHPTHGGSTMLSRRTTRKALQYTQKPRSTRAIRQSPIVKPQRKGRKGSTTKIPLQAIGDILEPVHSHLSRSKECNSLPSVTSTEESENGSISPEHLSDMAPPPLPAPGSTRASPYIQAQKGNKRAQQLVLKSPATPASLMRLTQSPPVGQPGSTQNMDLDDPGIDGFALPEAANSRPALPPLDTQCDGQMTPALSSSGAKTPGLYSLPSPAFPRPETAASSQSPQIDAINGTSGTSENTRKTPQLATRASKKRTGNSALVSPAILPRISPNIKPLLPGGTNGSGDTASLLLAASKSNYQNILEGTYLPGVSYPTELSTNLTSKRTSHKIAEQGRRNRINNALQEIATLLPRNSKDGGGEKSGSGEAGDGNEAINGKSAAQSANSKASTVEQAIDFIKFLTDENATFKQRAEEAEKELELLKERAAALQA